MADHACMRMGLYIGVATIVVCGVARAGEPPPATQRRLLQPPSVQVASPITDRFVVRAVYFRPSVSTTVRYDTSAGAPGTTFSAEDTLAMQDSRNQGWIDLMFRMTPRHRIAAQYYQLKRSGAAVLDQALDFGDETFQPGDGQVLSHMDMRQLNLVYTYSLLQQEQLELGLGFGIHLVQIEGTLEAPAAFKREHVDTAGPFPTLAGDFTWRFTRRFSANGAARFVAYSSGGSDASSLAWNFDVQFRAQRNLAVGLGYASMRYRVDSTDADYFLGHVKLSYHGPQLFLRASF
jgi:hypothetical protein